MKPIFRRIVVLSIVFGMLLPHVAFLAETAPFDANFLLSDEELQDYESMSSTDIQAFLEEKHSYLATYRTEDKNGTSRLASDIISLAAIEHKINPKYLLVKLQKEQSLITTNLPTEKQLNGATGYGISDSCGWSCETYLNNVGFGKQVDAAAAIMRWYYDQVQSQSWIKRPSQTYTIDNQLVTPATYATGFLYTYTPHIEGNKNFWNLWQSWFDQVYPDGTLIKSVSDPTVYLLQDGKKRPFASMSALVTRYNPNRIITIPSSEMIRYDIGSPISLPNYAVVKADNSYYLLDYDTKRPFASNDTVRALGYNPDEIIDVTESELASYTVGSPISSDTSKPFGEVIELAETGALYYLKDNQYFPIYDKAIAKENFPNLTITKASATRLKNLIQGPPIKIKDGSLILVEGDNKVYAVENGKKRHIASEAVFNGLGYKWENIIPINEFAGIAHETGEPIYLRAAVTTVEDIVEDSQEQAISDLMIRTPQNKYSYIGPQFDTSIDTYLVADYKTGDILAGKNIDTVRPTASLAKVMTTYQLMTDGLNLNASVVYNASKHKTPPEFHRYRIAEGERVRNKDLLDAVLISSMNTPVRMLVSSVTSDEAGFVDHMNDTLTSWGLTSSHLVDVYGGAVENHTTAREYMTIFTKGLSNDTVKTYLGTPSYTYDEMLDLDGQPSHADDHSNDLLKDKTLGFTINASKTGYIYESGDNLAMLVTRPSDGKQFIIITLGNPNHTTKFEDPKALTLWALKQL